MMGHDKRIEEALSCILSPEDLGLASTARQRDLVRIALGRAPVETKMIVYQMTTSNPAELASTTLPEMPQPIYRDPSLGALFNRVQMHFYAMQHAQRVETLLNEARAVLAAEGPLQASAHIAAETRPEFERWLRELSTRVYGAPVSFDRQDDELAGDSYVDSFTQGAWTAWNASPQTVDSKSRCTTCRNTRNVYQKYCGDVPCSACTPTVPVSTPRLENADDLKKQVASLTATVRREHEGMMAWKRTAEAKDKEIRSLGESVKNANLTADMYARAWERELRAFDGKIVKKRHHIDALVLTTQDLVRRARQSIMSEVAVISGQATETAREVQ